MSETYEAASEVRDALLTVEATLRTGLVEMRESLSRLAATAQQTPTPQSSVEIGQTSRGTNVTVKVYSPDPQAAAAEAQRLYDQLVATYAPKDGAP